MDITQMYLSSPDWLKLIWTVCPSVTIMFTVTAWFLVQFRKIERLAVAAREGWTPPKPVLGAPTAAPLAPKGDPVYDEARLLEAALT